MIVVTAPAGQIGRQVLERIVGKGEAVRAITRDPSRLPQPVADQVEIVTGSHDDPAVLAEAFAGADTVFMVVPPNPQATSVEDHYLAFAKSACEAIKSHGVRRMVIVSTLGRDYAKKAGLLSAAVAMDALIRATGVDCRVLRLPFFMENLLGQAEAICNRGVFSLLNAPDRPLATVAVRDIASVAANLLLDASWSGQEDLSMVGSNHLSPDRMAQVMCRVLRRPVHFQPADEQTFRTRLLGFGASAAWTQGLIEMAKAQDDGVHTAAWHEGQPCTPTGFHRWCEEVLRPAVRVFRSKEIAKGSAHLQAVDPVLKALLDKYPEYDADAWRGELPTTDLFGCLVTQIIGQRISLKAVKAILQRLCSKFEGWMPNPQQMGTFSEQDLRDFGLTWRKARTVLDLAARFADGRLSEQRLAGLSDQAIVEELIDIPGIGPWTVHSALLIHFQRTDIVPRNAIRKQYRLDALPTEAEFKELAARWSPYGSLGVNLLFAAAELDW